MRICVVSDAYYPYPSGVTEYAYNLSKSLREKGHSVTILTLHYPSEEKREGVTRVGRVIFVPMNGTLATVPLLNPIIVRSFFDRNIFDVVHLNGPFFPDISHWALKYSHAPCVATFHTTGFSKVTFGARYYRKVFPFYKRLKARIGVSTVAVDFIKPYIPGQYLIVPNGVDMSRFRPTGRKYEDISGLKGKKVLFLGRLDERKGLGQLLPAFRLLQNEMDVHLVIAGTGQRKATYESYVKEHRLTEYVHFLGFIPNEDIPSIYRSCDIYCSPALGGETFGIVLIEAMASGVPVIASNINGYRQVIEDGKNGLLFDPHSPEDIKERMLSVLSDSNLRNKLIKQGLGSVKQYEWKRVSERIVEIYKQVT
jgi:phosphatidylinositol alpha-mannosyltransferase